MKRRERFVLAIISLVASRKGRHHRYTGYLKPQWLAYVFLALFVLFVLFRIVLIFIIGPPNVEHTHWDQCPTTTTYPRSSPCYWLNRQIPSERVATP